MLELSRAEEFESFLKWLLELLEQERPDVLLVSGDIFDTSTPGETVRELYCQFLSRADEAGCRHVIITAGNHDGVAQLDVSKPLLKRHHCTVVTRLKQEEAEQCLVPICGEDGEIVGLVCAVPFLRPADVSLSLAGDEREYSYVRGVEAVYARVAELAEAWKKEHPELPVVIMGHLPVCGSEKTQAMGARYGTLDVVDAGIFAPVFDYVALGHIHRPTADLGSRVLYCGSPLPIGMDEVGYSHHVLVAELGAGESKVRAVEVPRPVCYEFLLCADQRELALQIERLKQSDMSPIWLSLEYDGDDLSNRELYDRLREALPRELAPVIRAARTLPSHIREYAKEAPTERLTDYSPERIFRRRLDEFMADYPELEDKRTMLSDMFLTVLNEIQNI